MLSFHRNTTIGKVRQMPIAEPTNDLLSVLKERINVIHYLCERLETIYGDQKSHEKLLAAVRRGVRHLDPVVRLMPEENPPCSEAAVDEVIGEHAGFVSEVCPNAGWFVAEIDSLIAKTAFELDPVLNDVLPFSIPESVSEEQLQIIRDSFATASAAFIGKINVKLEFDMVVENAFGL